MSVKSIASCLKENHKHLMEEDKMKEDHDKRDAV